MVEGKRLAKTNQCHLFLLEDKSQYLVGSASTQTENLDIRTVKIRYSEASTAVTALLEKRVIAIEDISRDERANRELMEKLGWRAAIFAPLLTKEQAIGVLVCSDDSRERKFTDEEILRAETLGPSGLHCPRERASFSAGIPQSTRMGDDFRRHAGLRFRARHYRQSHPCQCGIGPAIEDHPSEGNRTILF